MIGSFNYPDIYSEAKSSKHGFSGNSWFVLLIANETSGGMHIQKISYTWYDSN